MEAMPLIAILRGVTPAEVVDVGKTLVDAGFLLIEVPLNSPSPYESIRLLQEALGDKALIGAGTVLTVDQVDQVKSAGGVLIVSPNVDTEVVITRVGTQPTNEGPKPHVSLQVITHAVQEGLVSCPGFSTASEAFAALKAGAHSLKLFPANGTPPGVLKVILTNSTPTRT